MKKQQTSAHARRAFSAEFKADAVRLVRGGKSVVLVAKDLGLTETSIRRWLKQADADAGSGDGEMLTTEERQELSRLRREVKALRLDREILKAAATFFAKENA